MKAIVLVLLAATVLVGLAPFADACPDGHCSPPCWVEYTYLYTDAPTGPDKVPVPTGISCGY